jgi:ectoine hydroxylase-related dioxygenase (phytanoyl-CoA dioxygenase family)
MPSARPAPDQKVWIDEPDAMARLASAPWPQRVKEHVGAIIQRGYTVIPGAVGRDRCVAAIQSFRDWCEANPAAAAERRDEHGHYPRFVNFHAASEPVLSLFTENAPALEVQDACFGFRTQLYTSLFYERGSAQPMHRDAPYFRTVPENFYLGMWVALEDVDMDNGPLMVHPGGHRVPFVDPVETTRRYHADPGQAPAISAELWNDYQGRVVAACQAQKLETEYLTVKAGDTVLWHPLAPHGGAEIKDLARTRFSTVFHTVPEHVPVYQADLFFNPGKQVSPDPSWGMRRHGDRLIADLPGPLFG